MEKYIPSNEFEAIATIDAGYWMLQNLSKEIENYEALPPIARMIDKSCGRDRELANEWRNRSIVIYKDIVSAKEYLGIPSDDEAKIIESLS